jgi:hypothetical protein
LQEKCETNGKLINFMVGVRRAGSLKPGRCKAPERYRSGDKTKHIDTMKKLLLFILTQTLLFNGFSQVNYEHTYSLPYSEENFRITNLGNNNYKYVVANYHDSNFSLYNLDHTPYMLNIPVPLLTTTGSYNISYITSTLFDCDSTNIEYVLLNVDAQPTSKFYIYRTDGTIIFSRDSVTMPYCTLCGAGGADQEGITNTSTGAKMFLFNHNNQYFVYGLCGTLPENIMEINQSASYVKVFPNPTSNQINFNIAPPGNIEEYELIIFNSAFQTIKTSIISGEAKINLDCEPFSSGTYYYSLQNKNKVFQTGKFIVTK